MPSSPTPRTQGPLAGLKVLEFAGIGPGPWCGMLLADLGAEVLLLDRVTPSGLGIERPPAYDLTRRGKRQMRADLKAPEGVALALALAGKADVLIEGFRPGAMERLGLGPEPCLARNPALVYGRITGFGQSGPLSQAAGHDLNYIALSGALHAIGRAGAPPTAPLNLLGDYAGGSMLLAIGLLGALWQVRQGGRGQVVDAAMIEGAALLMTPFFGLQAAGLHDGPRGTNLLDGGAPFYDVYRCADGEYVSVAAIEPKFRQVLAERAGLTDEDLACLADPARWGQARERLSRLFSGRTRAQWCELLEGSDACFAPVLSPREAPRHPHHVARGSFVEVGGIVQPAPAPRFSATPAGTPPPPQQEPAGALALARAWGVDETILGATDTTQH